MDAADFRGVNPDLGVLTSALLIEGGYLHPPRGLLERLWRLCTGRSAYPASYTVSGHFTQLANSNRLPGRYRNRAAAILLHHRKEEILRRQLVVDEYNDVWSRFRR
jgi:hypothetical protein